MTDLSRAEFQHPRFAQAYLRASVLADRRGAYEHRRRLLAGLHGRVIEIGAGNGRNLPHYPPAVTEVVAVEPDDTLRAHAAEQARSAPVPVSVVPGHAGALPAADATMDAAVVSLVLCSVPEQRQALAEIVRVLVPGGRLHFYEHVRSTHRPIALLQDLITPAWRRAAGGCHPNRDTLAEIERAGFEVAWIDSFAFAPNPPVPPLPHILGTAVLQR